VYQLFEAIISRIFYYTLKTTLMTSILIDSVNTGDSTDNVRLSQQRADNTLAKLKDLGAKSSQLTDAEGYGSNHPAGDNGTTAGRTMNRRMPINVKAK
jgi:outer membrane protein OmpA-like peptidoglycan-associated protein